MNIYNLFRNYSDYSYALETVDIFQFLQRLVLNPFFTGIFGITFFVAVIIFVQKIIWDEEKLKLKAMNRDFLKAIQENISKALALHPELAPETKITGVNEKQPTDFGRIYSEKIDIMFPIEAPKETDSKDSLTHNPTVTKAKITISGTITDYEIELKDATNGDHLTYSSLTGEVTEAPQES